MTGLGSAACDKVGKILVVDDDATVRMLAREVLEQAGFLVEETGNGAEAVSLFQECRPDLVLLDVVLPGTDGFAICRSIRGQAQGAEIPILMMTGLNDVASINRAYETGATDFITKPVRWSLLGHRVRYMIRASMTLQELADSRQRYRLLFQSNPHPMWVFDQETLSFLDVNAAAIQFYGYAREEFLAMTIADIRPPEDLPRLLDSLSGVTEGLERAGVWRHCKKDGTLIYVEITSHTLTFSGRRAEVVLANDVTERLRSEEALRQSEEKYRGIVEGVYDIVYVVAPDQSFLALNQAFETISGWSRREWLGKSFTGLIHPEDLPAVQEVFRAGLRGDATASFELRILASSGTTVTLEVNLMPQVQDGRIVALQGVARDIGVRKQNERELDRVNRALKTVSECNRALVYARDEPNLLIEICRSIVGNRGYRFTWVGYALDDEARSVKPMASAGNEAGYLDAIVVTWDDTETGKGPVGSAIRSGRTCIVKELETDRGYCSAVGLPLTCNGKVFAALAIYASEPGAFDDDEVQLLQELAANLSYGIATLRMRHEHQRAEEALNKSQAQLKEALHLAKLGSWSWVAEADLMTWSEELCNIFSLDPRRAPRVMGDHGRLFAPQSRLLFEQSVQRTLATGEEFKLELELQGAAGGAGWIATRGAAIRDEAAGRIIGLHGTCQDVTERKGAEVKQLQLQRRLTAMWEIGRMVDADYKTLNEHVLLETIAMTDSSYGFFGYLSENESKLTTHAWTKTVMNDCRMHYKPLVFSVAEAGIWAEAVRTRKALIFNDYQENTLGKMELPEGHVSITRIMVVPIFNHDRIVALSVVANKESNYTWEDCKQVEGLLQNVQIVLEKRRVEEYLMKLTQAVEHSPVSIIITDLRGNIEFVNPKFTDLTGYQAEEVLGQNPRFLKTGETGSEEYVRLWETIASGGTWHGEFVNKKKNGGLFQEKAAISPVKNKEGIITHYVAIKEDITEQRQLEEQLRHSQKQEAIGTLAGGIAHDFNNILTAVIGNCALLEMKLPEGDPLRRYVSKILVASERATSLIRGVLVYSSKQPADVRPVDLNKLIIQYQDLLSRILIEDVELRVRTTDAPLTVLAGHLQIGQVLMNFAANARDAMPSGGTLEIATSSFEMDLTFARIRGYSKPGEYATITISDTGIGMDDQIRARIFEPFFTTKEVGKGTGLGLAITYGIVKQYGGYIDVDSKPGHGTMFTIYLPRTEQSEMTVPELPQLKAEAGTETILLVEDDEAIREIYLEVLSSGGYRVIMAANGEEAIGKFRQHRDEIQLLVLDVIMPKKNGVTVYEEIRGERPGISALFISGYGADILTERGLVNDAVHLVSKPISPDLLLSTIRKILDLKPSLSS